MGTINVFGKWNNKGVSFNYSGFLYDEDGQIIGLRFANPDYNPGVNIDIPLVYFREHFHIKDTENIRASIFSMTRRERDLFYEVNCFTGEGICLVFNKNYHGMDERINSDFSCDEKHITSFFYPNVVIRYRDANFAAKGWRSLNRLFNIVYGTDFIDRFSIREAQYPSLATTSFINMNFKSRIFYNSEFDFDEDGEIFKRLNKEFEEKYGFKNAVIRFGNSINVGTSLYHSDEESPEDSKPNKLPIFETCIKVKECECSIYQTDRDNSRYIQSVRQDNPYGINIAFADGDSTEASLEDVRLVIANKFDSITKFICIGERKFIAMNIAVPRIEDSEVAEVEERMEHAMGLKEMRLYKDNVIREDKDYKFVPMKNSDILFCINIDGVIDPEAYGERNVSELLATIKDIFEEKCAPTFGNVEVEFPDKFKFTFVGITMLRENE